MGGRAKAFNIEPANVYDAFRQAIRRSFAQQGILTVNGMNWLNATTRKTWHMDPSDMNITVTAEYIAQCYELAGMIHPPTWRVNEHLGCMSTAHRDPWAGTIYGVQFPGGISTLKHPQLVLNVPENFRPAAPA